MQEDTSTTRPHDGLGLGLAIVQHIVERHGGSVHAESAGPGRGATFSFLLPLLEQEDGSWESSPPRSQRFGSELAGDSAPLSGVDVLVVDDDALLRETLAAALERMGAAVRLAESTPEGLAQVVERPPDVIVCDISMPGQDGYAFLRGLRELEPERGGRTPALALSALAGEEHHARALAAGFHDHIAKPVGIVELARRLEELVEAK
jgi:CheY-like chemotaxis protein